MQERTALEENLSGISRIEQELEDQLTMIELGEAENDAKVVKEAEAALDALKAEAERPRGGGALVRRGGCQRQLPRGPRRGRGHREPGLGADAAAHVHALG